MASTGLLFLLAPFVHPFGPVKTQEPSGPLLLGSQAPAAVARVLERSCRNCHSEETEWPWYSYLPPVSWMIESDVARARDHMDLSRWDEYGPERQQELLTKMGVAVRRRTMPLPKYVRLHPAARLSDEEIALIYQWTQRERRRLRAAGK